MKMWIVVFLVVMLSSLTSGFQSFRGSHCFQRGYVPPKCWLPPIRYHNQEDHNPHFHYCEGFKSLVTCTLNIEVIYSSKMLVTTYKTKWCHNPEDHNPDFHCCGYLKSHVTTFGHQLNVTLCKP
jgi:hypothetical protein